MTQVKIYAYGGYSGLTYNGYQNDNLDDLPSNNYDHVYVLSVPSFIWTKVYDGKLDAARRGHRCQKISDNKMMVFGGVSAKHDHGCLIGDIVRVFNLNTLKFEDGYTPEKADRYKVPEVITAVIGGE